MNDPIDEDGLINDSELLLRLSRDEVSAYNEIFNRYWKKLYAVAYNRLRSKTASEDVVQDVLSSLWVRRHELGITSLGSYLGTAVRYAVFKQFNRLAANKQVEFSDLQLEAPQSHSGALEALDYQLLKKYIDEEVGKLPEKCQLVFKYSRESQFSNKEIASKLNLSEKTVEAHITKALKHLRIALKGFIILSFFVIYHKK